MQDDRAGCGSVGLQLDQEMQGPAALGVRRELPLEIEDQAASEGGVGPGDPELVDVVIGSDPPVLEGVQEEVGRRRRPVDQDHGRIVPVHQGPPR